MEKKKPVMEVCYNALDNPYTMPMCPTCNEPTYSEPACPFCGQPLDWEVEEKIKCYGCEKECAEHKHIIIFGRYLKLCNECYADSKKRLENL